MSGTMDSDASVSSEGSFLDTSWDNLDPSEVWFINTRVKLAGRLTKHAQRLRDDVYNDMEKRQILGKLIDRDRLDLLSLLLSHDEPGETGWILNLECCGPFRINRIFNELNSFQKNLLRQESSIMLDLQLRMIAIQIGRLRMDTLIVDEKADLMDEEAAVMSPHILGFQPDDPLLKSWQSMEMPFEACFCHRCKKY